MIQNACYSGPLWRVAYTEPRAELQASRDIRETLGFDVYAPFEKLVVVRRGRRLDTARPYFPRYLFVAVDPHRQDWQPILDIDGIVDVMRNNGEPSYVPSAQIAALRKAEEVGMFDLTAVNASKFEVGELVRISEGPFSGFNATIVEFMAKLRSATAKKRAKVLVDFMGRMTSTDLALTELEKL